MAKLSAEQQHPVEALGWAARDTSGVLSPFKFSRSSIWAQWMVSLITVSAPHPLLPLIGLLKSHGKLILVGVPEKPLELPVFPLIMGRKIVAGSCIGGIKETQEMIDFATKHNMRQTLR
ncbi:putative mannitol dehydrogenase [Camellia lanceoleosa]|uniref:Mannitol dehydrogenase n=1 Tax=Camellia lanceoleosa TaxID=1840588 RepID=A0ACC0HXI7_9ERIC|nr:putative mannitol dehydrogenase [Camellia lanceoleosa]